MKRLFGVKKPQQTVSLDDASKNLEGRGAALDEKIKKLDAELMRYKQQMAGMRKGSPALNGIRQRAMRVLQQKKMYENQRDQMMQQQFNIDQANFTQQSLKDTVVTVTAMKEANTQLKKQFKTINVDDIENMQDEMDDLMQQSNEIQEVLSRTYGVPEDIDESELDAELDMLESELDMGIGDATPSYLTDAAVSIPSADPTPAQPAAAQKVDEFGLPLATV